MGPVPLNGTVSDICAKTQHRQENHSVLKVSQLPAYCALIIPARFRFLGPLLVSFHLWKTGLLLVRLGPQAVQLTGNFRLQWLAGETGSDADRL